MRNLTKTRKIRVAIAGAAMSLTVAGAGLAGPLTAAAPLVGHGRHGADDPAGDDRGVDAPGHGKHGADDPAGDDRGVDAPGHA